MARPLTKDTHLIFENNNEKLVEELPIENPVLTSTRSCQKQLSDLVTLNVDAVRLAAVYIHNKMLAETYIPSTWRSHPLHLNPPMPYQPEHSGTRQTLDWIFLVSSLNFSFWSEYEDGQRFGVEWKRSWESNDRHVWTGYWSLLAAINRALDNKIPITDPSFYASSIRCPDELIAQIFMPHKDSKEQIPLLVDRIRIMREVGQTLCANFEGSYQGLLRRFHEIYAGQGTALQLVEMVVEFFPSFRDQTRLESQTIFFWKRAQILVAETWAAFYPDPGLTTKHPFFPHGVHDLTMFADYRVPQILHHLQVITYSPAVVAALEAGKLLPSGSREEIAIRSASILAVDAIRNEVVRLSLGGDRDVEALNSVMIDFWLWEMAKRIECGSENITDVSTTTILSPHRTRSIWY
ncbi:hypothetical protein SISNIDRAFT_454825 [Sistotremastrum niveocremeum HHB9708]|uniref:Queuosine 5'-phosphate N-glycosylase/hydrolase n=1 Tax=Sistotremastrum niveocremeum HHB9708 TaxID=1314777 RepID=A0A164U3V1_9AGAM|nr:hypothetical protein SISNIDRAFT_454825 [Sistotremastrum niveocremeum HHB9708]